MQNVYINIVCASKKSKYQITTTSIIYTPPASTEVADNLHATSLD